MNYSQKARNLTNRLNAINKEVKDTFKQFHKETGNKYVSKPNLTIAKMNSLKTENFKNFNASVNLKGPAKTKYYKQLRNLKKKALEVFDNKQKRVNLVKGTKLSRANAATIIEGSKLNLK